MQSAKTQMDRTFATVTMDTVEMAGAVQVMFGKNPFYMG